MAKRRRNQPPDEARTRAYAPPFRARFDPTDAQILDETVAFWQPHTNRQLTHEDAREMIENIASYFSILAEWRERKIRRTTVMAENRPDQSDKRVARESGDRQTRD